MTAEKRECVSILVDAGLSIVKACLFVGIGRATFYRPQRDWRKVDAAVIDAINAVLEKSPRAESPRVCQRLNNLRNWNYEKIKSLYIRIS